MRRRVVAAFRSPLFGMSLLLLCSVALFAQNNSSPAPTVRHAAAFGVSAPVRELAKLPPQPKYVLHANSPLRLSQRRPAGAVVDAVEQGVVGSGSNFSVGKTFSGVGLGFAGFTSTYSFPDANLAVGTNNGTTQIVQVVNDNIIAVFNTSGNATSFAPFNGLNGLWTSGPCSLPSSPTQYSTEGHPIIQWDRAAKRWLFAENVVTGGPNNYSAYACVAVSTSSDATGTYYAYQFTLGSGYPDLPKWAVWSTTPSNSDSYFQSNDNFGSDSNTFVGAEPCAYDRAQMLSGAAMPQQVCFQLSPNDFALMPGDTDSTTPPPGAQDEFLFSLWDSSDLALYSIHIDWSNPNGASITGNNGSQLLAVPAFTPACNGQYLGACVPQQGTTQLLDVLGDRLLYRVAYYDDQPLANVLATPPFPAPSQHWLIMHDVTASGGNTAERWYEIKAKLKTVPVTAVTLFQSGTYAPDSNYRWMGSIARDKKSNIMMGYSESSSSMYPSIAITGRLLGDPIGTMEDELVVLNGSGAHTGDFYNRWGNYTSMRLDPDGCTLWYTSEYFTANGFSNWSTNINSAQFAGCQ